MLDAVLGGEADPSVLADLARGRLRAKLPALQQALVGRVKAHHLIVIGQILAHIDFLDQAIDHLHTAIADASPSVEEAVAIAQTVPGIKAVAAAALIAEIGADMAQFPSATHLTSWVGVCPGNKQSGGRRLSGKTTKGNVWARAILGEVAWHVSQRPLPAYCPSSRQEQSDRRGRAQHPREPLLYAARQAPVRRSRGRLLRSPGPSAHRTLSHQAVAATRIHRFPRA